MSITSLVLRSSAWLFGGSILTRISSFFGFLLLMRALNVADYGLLVLLMSVAAPVNVCSGLGLEDTVVSDTSRRLGAGDIGSARAVFLDFVFFRFGMTLLAVIGGIVVLQFPISANFIIHTKPVLVTLAIYIISNTANGLLSMTLQVGKQFRAMASGDVIEGMSRTICLGTLFVFHQLDLSMAILAYALGKLCAVIGTSPAWVATMRHFRTAPRAARGGLWQIIRHHGKWEIARNVIAQMSSNVDVWSLGYFVNAESVGLLSVARNILSAINNLLPLGRIMTPLISESVGDKWRLQNIVSRTVKYATIYHGTVAVLALIFAWPALWLFFPAYLPSYLYIVLLIPRNFLLPLALVQSPLMFAFREQKYLLTLSGFGIASALSLLPLFVWAFGIYGVIAEYFISTLVVYLFRERRLRLRHGIRTVVFRELFRFDAYDAQILRRIKQKLFCVFRREAVEACDV